MFPFKYEFQDVLGYSCWLRGNLDLPWRSLSFLKGQQIRCWISLSMSLLWGGQEYPSLSSWWLTCLEQWECVFCFLHLAWQSFSPSEASPVFSLSTLLIHDMNLCFFFFKNPFPLGSTWLTDWLQLDPSAAFSSPGWKSPIPVVCSGWKDLSSIRGHQIACSIQLQPQWC